MTTSTARLPLEVRRPSLELAPDVPRYWYGGDPFATHCLNALSSMFPDGEAFFVRSVQRYRERIDDAELARAIHGFAGQEGQHSHQHDRHVELLGAQGYRALARLNRLAARGMRFENRHFPRWSLATTAALEHLTALLARRILERDSRFTAAMDPRMAALWRWHALEEAEHKAVAFDVLQRVAPSFALRVAALILATAALFGETLFRTSYMLWRDGLLLRRSTWSGARRFLLGRDGLLTGLGPAYRAWYRRDFHPNDVDDAALIATWRERVALGSAAPSEVATTARSP